MAQAAFYMLGYHFGVIDMESAMDEALSTVAGLPEDEVRGWTETWYEREVRSHAAPGAWPVLQEHRQAGRPLVLLTSSSPYEARMATEQFGLDHRLSTAYEVRDGRFTGRALRPICYGGGKVLIAERCAAEQGWDLDGSFFYTDSITDLPMLERVHNPRVVQPDLRLRRLARRRGWPVLDWSRADSALRSVA
jgi:HAD superfamily hydrolase (TIGR01490 family)